jgi:hypothetical protein
MHSNFDLRDDISDMFVARQIVMERMARLDRS